MSVFVLVHGSMHGGWCFRDLVPELEKRGHPAVAPDLPCDDATAGLAAYADVVEAALDRIGAPKDAVLVGHSLGCRTIPVVAARRPGARMVFLCSVPTGTGPIDEKTFAGMVTREFAEAEVEERPDGARRMREASAREVFFHDCDEATATWAAQQLRFQGPLPMSEPAPFDVWPKGILDIILTRDDRSVRFDWAMKEAKRWLDGRSPIVLPGSHSPFLSRPAELAEALIRCAGDAGRP